MYIIAPICRRFWYHGINPYSYQKCFGICVYLDPLYCSGRCLFWIGVSQRSRRDKQQGSKQDQATERKQDVGGRAWKRSWGSRSSFTVDHRRSSWGSSFVGGKDTASTPHAASVLQRFRVNTRVVLQRMRIISVHRGRVNIHVDDKQRANFGQNAGKVSICN